VEALVVPPPHPFQGGQLDLLDDAPWPVGSDEFGFVEPVHGLSPRVDAPICLLTRDFTGFGVDCHEVVDLADDVAFQASDDVAFAFSFTGEPRNAVYDGLIPQEYPIHAVSELQGAGQAYVASSAQSHSEAFQARAQALLST
jgi:hypothetical protein